MSRVTRIDLAKIFSKDARTIDGWVSDGMPWVDKPGVDEKTVWLFDTFACIEWYTSRDDQGEKTDPAKEAKTRQLIAESGMKWLEYGKALEELVPKYKIAEHVEAGDAIVKSRLRAIAGRLAQSTSVETDPAVCQRIIQAEVDEALGELNKHWSQRG